MLNLLIDTASKQAVRSLYSDRMLELPEFAAGEARAIACCPVKKIRSQYDSKLFSPIDPTAWIIQVALGGGFRLPVAGNWPIVYGANSSDAIISNDPTEDEISSVLNALASVIAAGGVTVQGASGFFVFTFNEVGARTMSSGDPSLLVPLSLLTFERVVTGDVDTQEVQILRIVQNAGSFATLATNTTAPSVAFSLIQAGDATHNAKWRVTLSPDRYAGYWTFTKPAGSTSGPIGFDDSEAQLKIVFEGIYGTGNVLVLQETEDTFTVEHIGANAHTAMTIVSTVDATALKTILFKSGVLDLRTPGVEMLLNGSDEQIVRFEVQAADATGYPENILQRDVFLTRPVLEPAMTQPQPQAVTFSGDFNDVTIAAAGTPLDLAPTKPFIQWFQLIHAQAGAGAYTKKVTLDNQYPSDGAIFRIEIDLDATSNPTIQIFDDAISGTMIDTINGDAGQSLYYVLEARFDGTNWKKLSGEYLT